MVNHLGTLQDIYQRKDMVAPSSEIYNANIKDIKKSEFMCVVVTFFFNA